MDVEFLTTDRIYSPTEGGGVRRGAGAGISLLCGDKDGLLTHRPICSEQSGSLVSPMHPPPCGGSSLRCLSCAVCCRRCCSCCRPSQHALRSPSRQLPSMMSSLPGVPDHLTVPCPGPPPVSSCCCSSSLSLTKLTVSTSLPALAHAPPPQWPRCWPSLQRAVFDVVHHHSESE